ncbi:MAG: hypothetical protein MJ113_03200 [Lachnospiraceae bacterium]|nr:hypothetical protein [Lachnospiraceae bacterium]
MGGSPNGWGKAVELFLKKEGFIHGKKTYFMENNDWFKLNEDKSDFVLTDKAPEEAVKSYNE